MDPLIRAEVDKLDSQVPFRASQNHLHSTWAKTFFSRPELYISPESTEEISKIIKVARRCRRRIVVTGSAHSPSDLTCTSSWMVNLDGMNKIVNIDREKDTVTMQSGIRLYMLSRQLKEEGLTLPNLGSIDDQSIAGVIATATHGSSLNHGLISSMILSLKIILANGREVRCSAAQNVDLFRAALVSLGALGIITEVTIQAVPSFSIEWYQSLSPLSDILSTWSSTLWTSSEFTRVWWLPYTQRALIWSANRSTKPQRLQKPSWLSGFLGYQVYQILLYISNYIPRIIPSLEYFVIGVQYGFSPENNISNSGVEDSRTGLLMNCLFSQFVNEWAMPISKGPEAINRLSAWINGGPFSEHHIPYSSKGIYVHAPIEVRISNTTPYANPSTHPRPFLDNTCPSEPTLYLNATLYRPFNTDPPCTRTYYLAFEYLMKDLGAKPHWAKNFLSVEREEIEEMYGQDLESWRKVRRDVDPDGLFAGAWHRRLILSEQDKLILEEREKPRRGERQRFEGGRMWVGEQTHSESEEEEPINEVERKRRESESGTSVGAQSTADSVGSFDMMMGAEASVLLPGYEREREYHRTHVEATLDDMLGSGDEHEAAMRDLS
ncbi:MAG: D-arabinono-1,4-lactone oxidase [Cirrosporium novae-zelandiae]|nr:MAG: D-arabinono-1,4-lactone oxidase [Cirrosporium novae-zelandiae]